MWHLRVFDFVVEVSQTSKFIKYLRREVFLGTASVLEPFRLVTPPPFRELVVEDDETLLVPVVFPFEEVLFEPFLTTVDVLDDGF